MQIAREFSFRNQRVDVSADYATMRVKKRRTVLSSNHKAAMFKSVFGIAILLVLMISTIAYGAQIKYEVNTINVEIGMLQSEIDTMNLTIDQQLAPAIIEAKAKGELGMVVPNDEQLVVIDAVPNQVLTAEKDK